MKILVTGVPNSEQLVRWMTATLGSRHSYYVLPATDYLPVPFHPGLEAVARESRGQVKLLRPSAGLHLNLPRRLIHRLVPGLWQGTWFRWMATRLKADVVHAIQFEQAGYQCLHVVPQGIPICLQASRDELTSLTGSEQHLTRVRALLERAAFCILGSVPDVAAVQGLGFKGRAFTAVLDVNLDTVTIQFNRTTPPSQRRTILIRDAGPSARTHIVLDALLPIKELVSRFDIVVYSASEEIRLHAHVLKRDHGLVIKTINPGLPHAAILELLGESRVSVGIGIPGGTSSDLLEAMAAGALPIVEPSPYASDFVVDGVSASLVDAHRPRSVTAAFERALSDDAFVDSAAELNWQTCLTRLDKRGQIASVHSIYDEMEAALRKRKAATVGPRSRMILEPHT